jgi:hypothetical protein
MRCRFVVLAGPRRSSPVLAGPRRSSPVLAGSRRFAPVRAGSRRFAPVRAGSRRFALDALCLLVLCALSPGAWAAPGISIHFKGYTADPLQDPLVPPGWSAYADHVRESALDLTYAVVQSSQPHDVEWEASLKSGSIEVLAFLPVQAYLVRGTIDDVADVGTLPGTRWLEKLRPAWKLDERLIDLIEDPATFTSIADGSGRATVLISCFRGEHPDLYVDQWRFAAPSTQILSVGDASQPEFQAVLSVLAAEGVALCGDVVMTPGIAGLVPAGPSDGDVDDTIWHVQTGIPDTGPSKTYDTSAKLFANGLFGEDETYGAIDLTFDPDSCHFRFGNAPADLTDFGTCVNPPAPTGFQCRPANKVISVFSQTASRCSSRHGTWTTGVAVGDDLAWLARNDDPLIDQRPDVFGPLIDHHDAGDGVAPGAQVVFHSLRDATCTPIRGVTVVDAWLQQSYASGARGHNDSWRDTILPWAQSYTAACRAIDDNSWQRRDLTIAFGAGNQGDSTGGCGAANTLDDPKHFKNGLLVGATNEATQVVPPRGPGEDLACYSSHGPAVGGRLKPDLVAPGGTDTADPLVPPPLLALQAPFPDLLVGAVNCAIATDNGMRGTSFAAPAVTGSGLLVREYFRRGFYPGGAPSAFSGFVPTNALVKALMVNATRNLPGQYTADDGTGGASAPRPSMGQGWGRLVLDDSLYFAGDPTPGGAERSRLLVLTDTPNGLLSTGDMNDGGARSRILEAFHPAIGPETIHSYAFDALPGEAIHVTLNWSDPPATVMAGNPLVNDLDLELVGPSGRVWRTNPAVAGGPGTCSQLSVWLNGVSVLGPSSSIPQRDVPPFLDFPERDCRNTTENVFLAAADVQAGRHVARVIGFSIPTAAPLLVDAVPNWNDVDGDLSADPITSAAQGYALLVSGRVANPLGDADLTIPPVPPIAVVDGCDPVSADGRLDIQELVNVFIPLRSGVDLENVTACLVPIGASAGLVQVGGLYPEAGNPGNVPTRCAVLGDMQETVTYRARFPLRLRTGHPVQPEVPFRLEIRLAGSFVQEMFVTVPMDPSPSTTPLFVNPTASEAGAGDCGFPFDPAIYKMDADGDTVQDDIMIEFCPGDLIPGDRFNVYQGDLAPPFDDHWSFENGACTRPCNDGTWVAADGRCEYAIFNHLLDTSSRYYLISGEATCSVLGEGAEGTLGHDSFGQERELGGGNCP